MKKITYCVLPILLMIILVHGNIVGSVQEFNAIGDIVKRETMNALFGGEEVENLIEKLGRPLRTSERDAYDRWYFKHGVEADIATDNDVPLLYNYVYLGNNSDLKTKRKIGIQSSKQQVINAYGKMINYDISNDEFLFAGTKIIGVIFQFKDNKVCAIFIALGQLTGDDVGFPNR